MGMASFIKKGESIFIPFRNGQSISDSQLKPRMYKTEKAFVKSFPGYYLGTEGVKLVEYAEVIHAHWEDGCAVHNGKEVYKSIDCSHCNDIFKIESEDREYWKERFKVCPFCGAVMDEVDVNV